MKPVFLFLLFRRHCPLPGDDCSEPPRWLVFPDEGVQLRYEHLRGYITIFYLDLKTEDQVAILHCILYGFVFTFMSFLSLPEAMLCSSKSYLNRVWLRGFKLTAMCTSKYFLPGSPPPFYTRTALGQETTELPAVFAPPPRVDFLAPQNNS